MEIDRIDIDPFGFSGFTMKSNDGAVHIKQLPYLSIVQSKVGSYGIKLGNGNQYHTSEGGFFIAPSVTTQTITHNFNQEKKEFTARYIIMDIIINRKYHLEDLYDLPVTTDANASLIFNQDFDSLEAADCLCDQMSCLYGIVKHLLQIATEKNNYRNEDIYTLIDYIKNYYMNSITISEMAEMLEMSESNFYAVFKKATGMPPNRYLNNYRLSVASELLRQTNDSVKQIAEKVGIMDQFYFSKLFKAKYLTSPQQYRKNFSF